MACAVRASRDDAESLSAPSTSPTPVLIVDDDVTTNGMLQAILKTADFHTHIACDALSALDAVRRERPDIIQLDVGLPG